MTSTNLLLAYTETLVDIVTLWPGSLVNLRSRAGITPKFSNQNDWIPYWTLKLSDQIELSEDYRKNKVSNYEGDNINLDNRKTLIKEQWEIIQRLNGDILKDILKVVGKEEIQQAELSRRLGFSKLFRDKNLKEENNWVVYSFAELGKTQGIIKTGNKGRNKYISSGENLEYKPIDFELLFDTGKRSKAESRIANILHSNKVTFQSQKKFRDLKGN